MVPASSEAGTGASVVPDPPGVDVARNKTSPASPPTTEQTSTTMVGPTRPLSEFAALVAPVGSARYDPADHVAEVKPIAISIPDINVVDAPIDPVGVKEGGELDVPDPLVVGWYRGSSAPGGDGASVLAAHVNFRGVEGVFRYLRDLDGGEQVDIEYEDGSIASFVITEITLYDKDELPGERVWAKRGDPTLVLFTCGGRYNSDQRSYEDNVVAYAVPIS